MRRAVRLLLLAASAVLYVVALAPAASAHSGIQSYVYMSFSDSAVDGRVEFPQSDLGEVLGIDFPAEPDAAEEVALANADAIRAYAAEHLAIGDPEGGWELSFTDDPTILPAAGGYVQVSFTVERSFDAAPRSFQVDYDGIIHANPERDALFIVENDWGTARFNNEGDHLLGFSVGLTSQAIELDDVGPLESIGAARGLGTDVLRDHPDHLLFVVALLLPAALAPGAGRPLGPAPTAVDATRRAAALLGVFIATSSLALWALGLAGADWSDDLVGALVAGSLLVLALYAIVRVTSRERLVVGALGAVQGVGFAHAYLAVRLDRVDNPLTLLAFNLGTIVGIVTIAVLVFPVLVLLRRTALAGVALYGFAGAISLYAVAWLIERIGGADLPVERVATPLTVWPRNLWLTFLAWAAAGGLFAWTARRDALRPLEGDDTTSDDERPAVLS
ncbi:MAG: HupE/UreJ family protein [Actinomycetota bacterium]